MRGDKTYLSFKNYGGSVQHYFHFLLGLLVPLVIRLEKTHRGANPSKFVIRSCGPMDRHLLSLGYPNLEIIPAFTHKFGLSSIFNKIVGGETLLGFDAIERYDKSALREAANIIKARLNVKNGEGTGKTPRIIAINRSQDRFYNTRKSEIKDSGAQRRSIPNFGDLEKHLASICPNYNSIVLEQVSLMHQVEQFQNADVVIAQHGAALANILFCKSDAKIIEIAPPNPPEEFFARLAECLGLNYCFYRQTSIHAEVNPHDIATLLNRSLALKNEVAPHGALAMSSPATFYQQSLTESQTKTI